MVTDRDIQEIKHGINVINQRTKRDGLYAMVFIAMIGSIKSCNRTQEIVDNYQKAPQVQVRNIIGNDAPERFYEIDGQRVYFEIDGKSVDSYFPRNLETEVENTQEGK
jgi:hypothetical protein